MPVCRGLCRARGMRAHEATDMPPPANVVTTAGRDDLHAARASAPPYRASLNGSVKETWPDEAPRCVARYDGAPKPHRKMHGVVPPWSSVAQSTRRTPRSRADTSAAAIPLARTGSPGSPWDGRLVRELGLPPGCVLVTITREASTRSSDGRVAPRGRRPHH